jgi:hypothetical protein
MMIERKRNLKAIKKINKRKMLGQLVCRCPKFLKHGFTQDGVESIYNIYLKHHLIKMDFQNALNTIDHDLTTSFNRHQTNMVISEKQMHHEIASIRVVHQLIECLSHDN